MGRRGAPQDSLTHCMMQRANRQANPSAGKEHKRFRLQTFAQPEYAVFDETLVWCALGSATGGQHVSAISHSRVHPVSSFKCSNRGRYPNENTCSCFSSVKKDFYKRSSFKSYSSSVQLRKQTSNRTNFSSVPKYERN